MGGWGDEVKPTKEEEVYIEELKDTIFQIKNSNCRFVKEILKENVTLKVKDQEVKKNC